MHPEPVSVRPIQLKRILAVSLVLAMSFTLSACDERPAGSTNETTTDSARAPETPTIPDNDSIPNWDRFPDSFRIVMMRGVAPDPFVQGNSLDGFEAGLDQGVKYVEADFLLSKDDHLIATHHVNMGGNCGKVHEATLEELRECRLSGGRRVAALEDLLALSFEEVYIDLKISRRGSDEELLDATRIAIEKVEAADRTDSAVLMLYRVPDQVAGLIDEHGIRAGTKGYPEGDDAVKELIDLAARHGMETMCINASNLTPELIEYSARKGVWQLPWDHADESNIDHWQSLAAAGMGGMIVDTRSIISDNVQPHWRDVRTQLD